MRKWIFLVVFGLAVGAVWVACGNRSIAPRAALSPTTSAEATDTAPDGETDKLKVSIKATRENGVLSVGLSSNKKKAHIYYTTNGTLPTRGSSEFLGENLKFSQNQTGEQDVVVIRAIAFTNKNQSKPKTHTFFLEERVRPLTFSLSTDPDNLTGTTGIFTDETQTGKDSERPIYVEIFDDTGKRVLNQDAGVRVQGGWTRGIAQKSLRLIARKKYGKSAFAGFFFPENNQLCDFPAEIGATKAIVLRNGGDDREAANVRNELCGTLGREFGLVAATAVPVAVYLNGEYYGLAWAQPSLEEDFLQRLTGASDDDFEILGDSEAVLPLSRETIDLDSMLRYYAFEVFVGNNDWPDGNLKVWRFAGENTGENPLLDGKWRPLFFDGDRTFGLFSAKYGEEQLTNLLDPTHKKYSPLLASLLEDTSTREQFAQILAELAGDVLAPTHVEDVLESLTTASAAEQRFAIAARKYNVLPSDEEHAVIRTFIRNRYAALGTQWTAAFGDPLPPAVTPRPSPSPTGLTIADASTKATSNSVVLQNNGSEPISLAGWSLTDNPEKPQKYLIPALNLAPGAVIAFVGKDVSDASALGKHLLPFNLSRGEVVLLCKDGVVTDSVQCTDNR